MCTSVAVGRPDTLAECFEALGDMCEFGIAQKFCGAEPLGLLRFAAIPLDDLLRLLANKLEDLNDPDLIDVFTIDPDPEWWGSIPQYGIRYHAAADSRAIAKADMLAKERKRVSFLARKLLEDLKSADKIFIRRDPGQNPAAIGDLHQALLEYGKNDLFWVDQAQNDQQIAKVEIHSARCLRGYLGHFWPNAAPNPGGLGIWLALLDQALQQLRPHRWTSLQAEAAFSLRSGTDNLLPKAGWHASPACRVRQTRDIPPVDANRPVLEHMALADISVEHGPIMECEAARFQPQALYVASAWVWLPEGFAGWVGMIFSDQPWVTLWPADTGLQKRWQRIATSFRCNSAAASSPPGLFAATKAGGVFYSTCWRVERGVVPFDCLPHPWHTEKALFT